MTADQMWAAFRKLDSGATVQVVKPGRWCVELPSVLYEGPHFLFPVAGIEAASRDEAIVATWNHLIAVTKSSRVFPVTTATGRRYEEVAWDGSHGSEWVRAARLQ